MKYIVSTNLGPNYCGRSRTNWVLR